MKSVLSESCSPPKRKMEVTKLASPLDSTFVLPTAKENKAQIITANNMMRKGVFSESVVILEMFHLVLLIYGILKNKT